MILKISNALPIVENNYKVNSELFKLLNNIKFIHADFTQTIINKSGDILQEQSGVIKLKKPNLLNWQILTPDRLLIIIDGKNIWNYDMDLEQITVKKFKADNEQYKVINLLLGNIDKNLSNFNLILLTNNYCNINNINNIKYCFRLTINNKDNNFALNFRYFDLGFNLKQQLVFLKLYDQLEQQTIFNFYKFKSAPSSNAFKFIIPQGIDLIKEID